ncbi:nucleotidyltransferase family protein [Nocardioides sp.]|uniref:nucleotidyltransferase family protein n=1 Tax=Nocardioides sp. TaxID=35761 RepID=UPI003569B81B
MSTALRLEEAVPLAYALADHVAREAGVRALLIKGPVADVQGVREPRQSVDADILVEPAAVPRFTQALEEIGWARSSFDDTPGIIPRHSVVHRHATWPCELDVHNWFPGMLADPAEIFDVLWDRRVTEQIAGRDVTCTDRITTIVIGALHAIRDTHGHPESPRLDALVERVLVGDRSDVVELADLAADIGATEPLQPFLDRIEAPQVPPKRPTVVPLGDWRLATGTTQEVLPWLVGLRREPWLRRPAYIWHAIWLPADRFREWDSSRAEVRGAVLRARLNRLRRALMRLPRAVATLRNEGRRTSSELQHHSENS